MAVSRQALRESSRRGLNPTASDFRTRMLWQYCRPWRGFALIAIGGNYPFGSPYQRRLGSDGDGAAPGSSSERTRARRLRISRSFLTGNFAPRAPQSVLMYNLRAPVLGHDACCAHDVRLFSQERIFCQRVKVFVRKEESGGSHRLDVSQAPKEVPWTVS
jgi:hypothetical protein